MSVSACRVMVATPAYGGMVHTDYVNSLFNFKTANIPLSLVTVGNESLITRARNGLLSHFYASPEFTHLLFLDADVYLEAGSLKAMLEANEAVLAAPVALKGRRPDGSRIWNVGQSLGSKGRFHKVKHVGTAALLLRRDAVNALVDDAKQHGQVYAADPNRLGIGMSDIQYDVFQVGVQDGTYLSEDYWACMRLRALGFDILIDATAVTRHNGIVEF